MSDSGTLGYFGIHWDSRAWIPMDSTEGFQIPGIPGIQFNQIVKNQKHLNFLTELKLKNSMEN